MEDLSNFVTRDSIGLACDTSSRLNERCEPALRLPPISVKKEVK